MAYHIAGPLLIWIEHKSHGIPHSRNSVDCSFIHRSDSYSKGFTILRAYIANPLDLYLSKNLIDILARLHVLFDLCFLRDTFLPCMKEIREDVWKKSMSLN